MIPHEVYDIPWFKVGSDIFEFNKKQYLIVVDYYSKFYEIDLLNNGYSSPHVITKLKSIFARYEIPKVFISDNGPPYNSKEFQQFCNDWGIDHKTSSPYLPRSNGLAERTIQTVKKMLIKCLESKSDPYIALLMNRTTPKGNMPSPAELLMARNLRTKLPTVTQNLQSKLVDQKQYKNQLESQINKSAEHYNKTTKKYKTVSTGDGVMFKMNNNSFWSQGEIISKCEEPRSFVVRDNEGTLYRRSEQHISKRPESSAISKEDKNIIEINEKESSENSYVTESNNLCN
ncbi:hypothetical protein CVS40_3384 [Lucilia cuprina]|nr:hypothetical protein CVS40_3384 [Lucilia cuprina]